MRLYAIDEKGNVVAEGESKIAIELKLHDAGYDEEYESGEIEIVDDREQFLPKIKVEFEGGESRMNAGRGCNYMYVALEGGEELYAEYLVNEDDDEDAGYEECKEEIIRQAAELGIEEELEF